MPSGRHAMMSRHVLAFPKIFHLTKLSVPSEVPFKAETTMPMYEYAATPWMPTVAILSEYVSGDV